MGPSHSIRARRLVAATLAVGAIVTPAPEAQTPAAPTSTFIVFLRARPIGSEQVAVQQTAGGWTISGSGRMSPPIDLVARDFSARYDADWKPVELHVDATLRGASVKLHTTIRGTTAESETIPLGGMPTTGTEQIDGGALLLPSPFVAPYEALSARLKTAQPGSSIAVYQPPQGSFVIDVGSSSVEQIKTVARTIEARRTRLTLRVPTLPPMDVEVWGDERGRLLRVSLPAQGLEFAREDVASVAARLVTMSRATDEDLRVPANGFSLAGTVSKPAGSSGRLPAIVLAGGATLADRDETTFGIPLFGQLADTLADAGFLVVRYDKRGVGQSGGRPEAARLADFADDARAVVKAVSERADVDRKRVALVGYGEGGWIAMLAAVKNSRVAAVGLLATVGVTGEELNLYQVKHGLERSGRPEAEHTATLALQQQIQKAVITGTGWETLDITEPIRRQADTPYFQSFLTLDPSKIMKDVAQPVLIVHGERDAQVPPSSADRLEALAKARKKRSAVEVVKVAGVNHLLVPAETGETDEYDRLPDRRVSPGVTTPLIAWLQRTMSAPR